MILMNFIKMFNKIDEKSSERGGFYFFETN